MFLCIYIVFLIGFFLLTLFFENKWNKDKYNNNILEILDQPKKKIKLQQKPTLEDGNCFYSAIYRSLFEKDILEDVSNVLHLNFESEESFILDLRYFLSNYNSLIHNYQDLFYTMILNFQEKDFIETFKYILADFGDTRYALIKFYKENKFQNEYIKEFIINIQKLIQMNQTFVGEIEVNNMLEILREYNFGGLKIEVVIFHDRKKAILFASSKNFQEIKNLLILLLENEHWTYL